MYGPIPSCTAPCIQDEQFGNDRFREPREPVKLNCALPDLSVLHHEKGHKIHMYTKSTTKIRIRKFYPKATKLKPIHLNKTKQLFPMDVVLTLKPVFFALSPE